MAFEVVCKIICVGEYENCSGARSFDENSGTHKPTQKVKNHSSNSNASLLVPTTCAWVHALIMGIVGYCDDLLKGRFAFSFLSAQSGFHRAPKVTFVKLLYQPSLALHWLQMKS